MSKPKKPSKFDLLEAIKSSTGTTLDPKSARQSAGVFLTNDADLLEDTLASKRISVPKPKPDVPVASRYFTSSPGLLDEYGKKAFDDAVSAKASKMPVSATLIPEVVDDAMPLVKSSAGTIDDALVVSGKSLPKSGLMSFLGKHGKIGAGLLAGGAAIYALTREDKPNVSSASKPAGADENKAPDVVTSTGEPDQGDAETPVPQTVENKALERNFQIPELKFEDRTLDIGTRQGPSERELLETARNEADKHRTYALITRMGSQLGKAISGGTYEIDDSAAKLMDENADRRVQYAKEDIAMQERDPNSPASKLYKQLAAQMGFNIKGDLTATTGKEILPQLQATYEKELNRQLQLAQLQGSAEERDIRRAEREDSSRAKSELKMSDRQDKFINMARKASSDAFAPYQKVNKAKRSIETNFEAINNGANPGPRDVSILYDFIKVLDPDSAVREGEIALTQQGMSILESAGIKVKKITQSSLLSPEFRKGVLDVARDMESRAKQEYQLSTAPLRKIATQRGISEDRFEEFDPLAIEDLTTTKPSNVNSLIESRSEADNKKRLEELRAKHLRK